MGDITIASVMIDCVVDGDNIDVTGDHLVFSLFELELVCAVKNGVS